jgi:hypothetical protein
MRIRDGVETVRIRDPVWRQFVSGKEKSRIRDEHLGSATLVPSPDDQKAGIRKAAL